MPDPQMLFVALLALCFRAIATCLKTRRSPPPRPEQIFDALGWGLGTFAAMLGVAQMIANSLWPL